MKTKSKLLLIAALGLGLARSAVFAQTDSSNQPPAEPLPGPPPGHHLSQLLTNLLDKYDVNKDGILDQTELATLKKDIEDGKIAPPPGAGGPRGPGAPGPHRLPKEILDKYDVNKDGVLDENERAALRKDVEAGKVQLPGRGGPPPALDAKQVLLKFDANKDGMLDETELTAFLKDLQAHRPPPPLGPGGPGAPGGPPPGDAPADAPPQ